MPESPLLVYRGEILGGYGYVEKPWFPPHARLRAFVEAIESRPGSSRWRWIEAPPAADADILLVHGAAHLERVRRLCAADSGALDHGATPARRSVEEAATRVVGAVVDALDRICAGEARRAFVPIAGFHHALPDQARNYCLYNDSAIALRALHRRGIGKVAYVDTDVHHGDGVYTICAADPLIFIVDIHEDARSLWPHSPESPGSGAFPGDSCDRGEGIARGSKLNISLAAGADDADFDRAWAEALAFLVAVAPEFIVFEVGVDALAGDPLGHLALSTQSLVRATTDLCRLADRCAQGRLLVLGGGGYELHNVVSGWSAVVDALLET